MKCNDPGSKWWEQLFIAVLLKTPKGRLTCMLVPKVPKWLVSGSRAY